jgi:acetylornithine deacetylase/succinyl-diaminopimelate desuccinylase-like protein
MPTLPAPSSKELAAWLSRLVKIPSVSPSQAANETAIAGENRMATALSNWFRQFGGDVYTDEVFPERPNVYAIWWGTGDKWRAIDVHTDTVGVTQMTEPPFSGTIEQGKVRGRGAADTKATLGVVLAILEKMHRHKVKLDFNLLVIATADEETGMAGAKAFARWIQNQNISLDELLVAEPTLCQPMIGHKGDCLICFDIQGKAAHSSVPEQGENAITAAGRLITALDAEHQRLQKLPALPPLGHAKLTVSQVEGGNGLNTVPDHCRVWADRRTLPGEDFDQIRQHFTLLAEEHCRLPVTINALEPFNPFLQSPDTAWVQHLAAFTGLAPSIVPYCTNAANYAGLAREIVVLGPGSIDQAHGAKEWIEISELERMRDILLHWWELS